MTRLARAVIAAALPLALLTGCAPAAEEAAPVPTFSPTPSPPPGLPTGRDLEGWAAEALPENRAGGSGPVLRMEGTLDTSPAAAIDISQGAGLWDLLITCLSEDASPITYDIVSPTSSIDGPTELSCPGPDGEGVPATAVVGFDGADAVLHLAATADAVFAFEVRRHDDAGV